MWTTILINFTRSQCLGKNTLLFSLTLCTEGKWCPGGKCHRIFFEGNSDKILPFPFAFGAPLGCSFVSYFWCTFTVTPMLTGGVLTAVITTSSLLVLFSTCTFRFTLWKNKTRCPLIYSYLTRHRTQVTVNIHQK